jgi:hypothetical protein
LALFAAPQALAQQQSAGGDLSAPPTAQAVGTTIAPPPPSGSPLRAAPVEEAAAKPPRCQPLPDHQPHGEVWGAVGTHGYREGGGVVTQPLGDCASVTLSIDESKFDFRHRR